MLSFTTEGFGIAGAGDVPVIAFRIRDADGRLAGTAMISKPAGGHGDARRDDLHRRPRARRADGPGREGRAAARRRSCSPTSKRPRRSRGACRPPATSRSAGASSGPPTSASSTPAASWADTSATASSRSSSPRPPDRNRLRPAAASPPPAPCARRSPTSPRAATCSPKTSSCASACTGERPSTSATSAPPARSRSPRSATRSTRPRASRPARPAAALASKDLVERLEPDAAAALGLDPDRVTYTAARRPGDRDREGPPRRPGHRRVRDLRWPVPTLPLLRQ